MEYKELMRYNRILESHLRAIGGKSRKRRKNTKKLIEKLVKLMNEAEKRLHAF